MPKKKTDKTDWAREALYHLYNQHFVALSCASVCEKMGIKRNRQGRWSKENYPKYAAVGQALQKLKRAGHAVIFKGAGYGPGGSWKITTQGCQAYQKIVRDERSAQSAAPASTSTERRSNTDVFDEIR